MADILVVTAEELPPPAAEYDLVIWQAPTLPKPSQVRAWAGWSEASVLVRAAEGGEVIAFRDHPEEWPGIPLAIGSGMVWRFDHRHLAWLDEDDLAVPEIPRALARAGVDLVIAATHDMSYAFLDPLWRAVQANQFFGLRVADSPTLYLPCELDAAEQGIRDLDHHSHGSSVSLDFNRLPEARRLYPLHQTLRPSLYQATRWWER